MFQISFSNWTPACNLLTYNISQWYSIFFIVYRCMIISALMKVITAVFIGETNRILLNDMDFQKLKKKQELDTVMEKLQDLFETLDTSGDGNVHWEEFLELTRNESIKEWARTLDINLSD